MYPLTSSPYSPIIPTPSPPPPPGVGLASTFHFCSVRRPADPNDPLLGGSVTGPSSRTSARTLSLECGDPRTASELVLKLSAQEDVRSSWAFVQGAMDEIGQHFLVKLCATWDTLNLCHRSPSGPRIFLLSD